MFKVNLGIAILALTSAACQSTATTNTANTANTARANQVVVTNSNVAVNANSMSANMSNTAMNGNTSGAAAHDSMDHGSMHSSPNAANAPFDLQFLDTMVHHHEGAVEMAQAAETRTQNPELKQFAKKIIDDQQKEIAQMKSWREKWYAGKPAAMNMEMPGMADSMKMMTGDGMKKMEAATGKDFDLMFVEMMIPHHVGAVTMGKDALTKAEHPEIKTLSNQIIKAQEAEIKMMNDWKAKWFK